MPTESAMNPPPELGPGITMERLLEIYPGARRALFKKYHIGGCSSCGFLPQETLAEVLARQPLASIEEALEHLRASLEQDNAMEIDPREVARLRDLGEPVRLLDIRTREEWEAARIDGAEFVNQALVQSLMGAEGHRGLLVFYDHLGKASLDAAAYFWGHGFQNARSMRGGIDRWALDVNASIPRYRLEPAKS